MMPQFIKRIVYNRRRLALLVLSVGVFIAAGYGMVSLLYPPYPDDVEETMITWEEAVEMVRGGSVVAVRQSHSLKVTLVDDQNNTFVTKEPRIDAILNVIYELEPEMRENISVAIE